MKTLSEQKNHKKSNEKEFLPIFYRSPKSYNLETKIFQLYINKLNKDNDAIQTTDVEDIETDLIFRSIGYTAKNIDDNINFNTKTGCINNIEGNYFNVSKYIINKINIKLLIRSCFKKTINWFR